MMAQNSERTPLNKRRGASNSTPPSCESAENFGADDEEEEHSFGLAIESMVLKGQSASIAGNPAQLNSKSLAESSGDNDE
jgi:hypothetical protein